MTGSVGVEPYGGRGGHYGDVSRSPAMPTCSAHDHLGRGRGHCSGEVGVGPREQFLDPGPEFTRRLTIPREHRGGVRLPCGKRDESESTAKRAVGAD
jgi:hypothetical protein